jgi:SAM-dependent methyltransferase
MSSFNVYEDAKRAAAYDKLEFPGTYYLAFRDLPDLIRRYVKEGVALDFGCGTGRSTRFLKGLGLHAVGVDISSDMIARARQRDPEGDYRLVPDDDFSTLKANSFSLILSAFTFDNIPTREAKTKIFRDFHGLLTPRGIVINLVSSPQIYMHEWASFTTKDFPENKKAHCGDPVKIIMTDVEDRRPVVDIVWPDQDYRDVYAAAGWEVLQMLEPLARGDEPYPWKDETRIAPWVIYLLRRKP